MRVLHVIPSVSRVHGGPSRAIVSIERALARRNIQVTTLTTDDDGPGRRLEIAAQRVGESNVSRIYLKKRSDFYKFAPSMIPWLAAHIDEFDLVHIHALFSFPSVAAGLAARRARVPYIIRPLGTLARYGVEKRRPMLKRLSLSAIERPLLRSAAAVHFTSDAEEAQAAHLAINCSAVVLPLGFDLAGFDIKGRGGARLPSEKPTLIFLSRIDAVKNIEGFLEALAILKAEGVYVKAIIAGDGRRSYIDALKGMAGSLSIADSLRWVGDVEGAAKEAVFGSADLFVLPSFSENFGIAAVEALSAGIPCILGKGVAIAAQVADAGAGVVVEPNSAAIADAIKRLLSDRGKLIEMGARAVKLAVENYSSDAMGDRLVGLYESILRRSRV